MHDDESPPTADDVAALLDFAGRRPRLPEEEVAPIRAAAREAFRRQARRTVRRRRTAWAVGGSLAAGLVLALRLIPGPTADPEPGPPVAAVEALFGDAVFSGDPSGEIRAGEALRTGRDGRAAVRFPTGESLRIDTGSVVRFDSSRLATLEQGAVYVDAGLASPPGRGLEIATPLGSVRHVGTQFEARLLPAQDAAAAALRVRVREGTVLVEHAGESQEVRAGGELLVPETGPSRSTRIPVHGPEWDWVLRAARPFEIEGVRLAEFLDWFSRETGLRWQLGAHHAGSLPQDVVLHGSIEGLTAEEALSVVLASSGFRSRRVDGRLWIESSEP